MNDEPIEKSGKNTGGTTMSGYDYFDPMEKVRELIKGMKP